VHLAPWQWEPEAGRLARIEKIGDRLGTLEVRQRRRDAIIVGWNGFGPLTEAASLGRVRRWLSADWEPSTATPR
jgi:hypothetical protein